MSDTALVTLAVGPRHAALWERVCRPNWHRYAAAHGYDVICLQEPLDRSDRARVRSPAWQKCLVLGQPFAARYDRVVWIDSDVLLNPDAPPIAEGVPADKVGAVDEFAMPTAALYQRALARLYRAWAEAGIPHRLTPTAAAYYGDWGLPDRFAEVVQTGVMVLSPQHHRELLEDVYASYEDRGPGWNYEMRPLSHDLLAAGVVHWLDPRFNYLWGIYRALHFPELGEDIADPRTPGAVREALGDVHALHFAGAVDAMALAQAPAPPPRASGPTRSPVVVTLYDRPDLTRRLIETLRRSPPPLLLAVTDAAPARDVDRQARCDEVRELVAAVDFCEVTANHAPVHQGIKARVESGLSWAFGLVEEAIVLEDDCAPHPSFFAFCDELLARFRDEPRVMAISGTNYYLGGHDAAASYSFSRLPHVGGWATWRRAWEHYDPAMAAWPELARTDWLADLLGDRHAVAYWSHLFERTYQRQDAWDYAWVLACWRAGGLTVTPAVNLVANRGFRADATNSTNPRSLFADLPTEAMRFPLRHPATVAVDRDADAVTEDVAFSGNLRRLLETVRASARLAPEAA